MALELCPSKFIGSSEILDPDMSELSKQNKIKIIEINDRNYPNIKYIYINNVEGICNKFVAEIFFKKQECDDKLKQKDKYDCSQIAVITSYRYAYKIIINTIYGAQGQTNSPLCTQELAMAITDICRKVFNNTVDIVENKIGSEIIFGDTDSVMFSIPK